MADIRLALNADTTPLAVSDTLVFKSCEERAREASLACFQAVNVDRCEPGLTPEKVEEILSHYQLQVASGFFHAHFQDSGQKAAILDEARRQAEFSRAIGQDCLFVSAFVSPPERFARAGRIRPGEAVSLSESEFRQFAKVLEQVAQIWREFGICLCYHPHVATYVEAPHEIDRLMELTDPDLVRLGPDTGHTVFGGGDPLRLIETYFDRVDALHIKDIQSQVLQQVRQQKLDYRQACARGIWIEIGQGDIDFPRLFSFLREKQWSGWVIVETDHTQLPAALDSSRVSRQYLRDVIGL